MEPEPEPELQPEPEPEPEPIPTAPEDDPQQQQQQQPEWSDDADDWEAEDGDGDDGGASADGEYSADDAGPVDGTSRGEWEDDWSSDSGGELAEGAGDEEGYAADDAGGGGAAAGEQGRWARPAPRDGPEPPASLCCPFTLALLSDPVTVADGHTYERRALTEWFDRGHRSSPVTRKRLASREMHTNFLAKQAVESYQQKMGGGETPTKPAPPSRSEVLLSVDRFEDERSVDTGEIRRRNRRTRRAAAWDEQINHIENWIATVDPASGQTYYYNRLTRVTQWEEPMSSTADGGGGKAGEEQLAAAAARPVEATHPGMAAFPGMKPADTKAGRSKGGAYGLCVWLSAVILVRGGRRLPYPYMCIVHVPLAASATP
jgi:hypothetical protein